MILLLLAGFLVLAFGGNASASLLWESDYGTWSDLSEEDDDSEEYSLGFDFVFYGQSYNSVYVNSNGALHFDDSDDTDDYEVGDDIEDGYDPTIASFWADLDPDEGGDIYYNTLGSSGNMRFVVTWDDVYDYEEEFYNTFQVILFENGLIQFGYQQLNGSGDDDGEDVIGVSQGDGTHFTYFIAADGNENGIYPDGQNLFFNWNPVTLNYDMTASTAPVPEPTTILLFGLGILGFAGVSRRKK
ncbi:MAG: PEP-CTERM sorting domain-containing protein [Candidatus Marinimicrobia bacterium]|nr:PEP-CTERM sorting domain-containing protein [Candidatus Neomarinimicrobiota bacterium]